MLATSVLAGDITYEMIPNAASADDMTPDGRFVVGGNMQGYVYRYDTVTREIFILPGEPGTVEGKAISDDGTVVLGDMIDENDNIVAGMWTQASGTWTSLGFLLGAGSCPSRSDGYELSADGTVAVGLSWEGCSGRGFRWTAETGMIELEPLANGGNRASVVSSDGNVIGGFAQGSFSRTPTLWGSTGVGDLLDPPDGDALGEVHGINDAGSIMLGTWNGKAVTWEQGGALRTQLGQGTVLPGWQGIPLDMANNGTTVGFDILGGNRRAWIRVGASGPLVDLKSFLEANGVWIGEDVILEVPQAISVDATKIIGHSSFYGAWIVTFPAMNTCPADLAPAGGDGHIDGADLGFVLGSWGTPRADLNGDGNTDGADLGALLGEWGNCPAPVGACCTGDACSQMSHEACLAANGIYLGNAVPCGATSCISNDHCEDAIDITGSINGWYVSGDSTTATPGNYSGSDPELPVGSPSCQWNGNPSSAHSTVWFKFTAPENGKIFLGTCNSVPAPFFDSTIVLYAGTCGSFVEVACGEDSCAVDPQPPYYSSIQAEGLTPGATYYVAVMNPGDWLHSVPGPFKLSISTPVNPGP